MSPYGAIACTILLFSTIEVAVKLLPVGSIDSNLLASLRFLLSGTAMLILSKDRFKHLKRKELGIYAVLGVVGIGGTFGPYHAVLSQNTPAEEVALIFSINPLFATIGSLLILGERPRYTHWISLLVGLAGVYIVKFGFQSFSSANTYATALLLWSALSFGLYTTFTKRVIHKHGGLFTTGAIFIFGGLALLPFASSFSIDLTLRTFSILAYLIGGTTFVGYLCYFYGLKRLPIAAGTSLFYLKPLLATIFSIIFLKTEPQLNFYIGMTVILSALALNFIPGKKT